METGEQEMMAVFSDMKILPRKPIDRNGDTIRERSFGVKGKCMMPWLNDRETIIQDAVTTENPIVGDIGVVVLHGGMARFAVWGPEVNNNRTLLTPNKGDGHGRVSYIDENNFKAMVVIGKLSDGDLSKMIDILNL